ncbi:hypothetical protein ACXC9Q_36515 [Kribbella sp. CWNU-51]
MTGESSAAAASPTDVARRRLFVVTGISGLAATVLILVAVAVGTRPEPSFNAPASEFLAHYRSPNTAGSESRSFLLAVGLIAFVWFVVALTTLLRRAEGELPWRSTVALVSGVIFPALVLSLGNEMAAVFRADDLDPQIARYAFDESQAAFANARVAGGSFAVCCGWVIVSTRFLPRWLGWPAIAIGVGLALSRISWTSPVFLLPYLLFWLWVLVVAVLLIRRGVTGGPQRRTG